MYSVRRKLALVAAVLIVSVLACNLPGPSAPTPFALPTPDLTLTSVFNSNPNVLPTSTHPVPALSTSTPTAQAQASATLPGATNTLIPPTVPSIPASPTSVPPTATTAPTRTQVSYSGPGARQSGSVTAFYMTEEAKIDGVFDEWNVERYPVSSLIMGGSNWAGEADLSGNFMLAWDENNLYIAARIRDDHYVQNATGENIYKGDSVEILLDTNVSGDYYLDSLSGDDFQLGISPGSPSVNTEPESYLWYPQSAAGYYQKVKASATPMDGGYRLEMKIPWFILGVTPAQGQHLGFAFSISDNDGSGKNVQESMVSNVPTRVLTDPTTWGDLVLSGTPVPAPNPESRSGNSIAAAYLSSPPALDGSLGEWSLIQYPVNNLVYGADKWEDNADLSGSVMVGWDENNLYLGVRGVDKRYVQNATGENIFLGDSLEILLDSRVADDFYDRNLSADDYQLGISPGTPNVGSSAEAYLWYPGGQAGSRAQVKIAAIGVDGGYMVEASIPWSTFGITPGNGQHYGFAFSISDNDNLERNSQQSLVCNTPGRILTDPNTWGDLTLVK